MSLKFLYEMFLPEARFPDEKFWTKDGDAIQAPPKRAPLGSVGKTFGDIGANKYPNDYGKPDLFNSPSDVDDYSTCPDCNDHQGSGHYPEECPDCGSDS